MSYGFQVAGCRRNKFSFIGWCIQFVESLNILITEKRLTWYPMFHWAFYDELSGYWFNSDGLIEKLTDKEFRQRYHIEKHYNAPVIVPEETRAWLYKQVGKKYPYKAIALILRKFKHGKGDYFVVDQDEKMICTELVLKAVGKCGFYIDETEIEVSSIYETEIILERLLNVL